MKRVVLIVTSFTLFILFSYSQAVGDYRSFASGPWSTTANWQRFNGAWIAAPAPPTSADGVITIQAGHTMQITANLLVDDLVINGGGTVNWTGGTFTVNNGAGVDIQVDGMFWDNRNSGAVSATFNAGATWQMGVNGTLRRSASNSSNNWQNAYQGGIALIPATSNWVLQKNAAQNPSITTTGAFYGNLTIENNTATAWNAPPAPSTFQGGGLSTIKGNLDIGGTGTNAVSFVSQITGAPTLVQGNIIVRAGCNLKNYGSGIEVQGNLTVTGTMSYDGNDARTLLFSGGNNQTVTSAGDLAIYNLTLNKTAGTTVTLSNAITVDNTATFTSGVMNTTAANLLNIWYNGSMAGGSNTSYVNGPVRYWGPNALTFTTGKTANWQPIGISSTGLFADLLTQNWTGGAGTWTLNSVTGAEGADPNFFQVTANEGGVTADLGSPASCGVANNGNNTLHVTSVFNPPGGAAYDAGGLCGILFCPQANRRTESPVINCTGRTNVYVKFDYIENGEALNDNATLQYFDGAVWSTVHDMRKTPTGCAGGQGQWTTRIVFLPASANNNPNVRIAFRWVNNDDGVGTDPSFAVDNIIVNSNDAFTAEYFMTNPQIPYGNILVPSLTNLSDCEYWILDRLGTSNSRNVTLTWNAISCYNTAFASFEVARYDGVSTWQDHDGIVAGVAAGGTVTTPAVVNSFSPFAIAYVPLPLPVELLSFSGACDNGLVKLNWETGSEINNDYFLIEKSIDLIHWNEISRIEGAGNSNSTRSYSISDINNSEACYYRITQFDFNGDGKTYDPISVKCSDYLKTVSIYPNPTTGSLNVALGDKMTLESIQLYSPLGQLISTIGTTRYTGQSLVTLDLSYLSAGTYYLKMRINGEWIARSFTLVN